MLKDTTVIKLTEVTKFGASCLIPVPLYFVALSDSIRWNSWYGATAGSLEEEARHRKRKGGGVLEMCLGVLVIALPRGGGGAFHALALL